MVHGECCGGTFRTGTSAIVHLSGIGSSPHIVHFARCGGNEFFIGSGVGFPSIGGSIPCLIRIANRSNSILRRSTCPTLINGQRNSRRCRCVTTDFQRRTCGIFTIRSRFISRIIRIHGSIFGRQIYFISSGVAPFTAALGINGIVILLGIRISNRALRIHGNVLHHISTVSGLFSTINRTTRQSHLR